MEQVYNEACEAGMKAMAECTPTPMTVVRHADMLDDTSPIVEREVIEGGVCGFAWILITPARGPFVTWCKQNEIGRLAYEGGWRIGVKQGGQSMERKEAYAKAFAEVLNSYGINCYADSRLD